MKSKKSVELTMQTIVVAIMVLVVLIVSIYIYTKYINKSVGRIDDSIEILGDYDYDNDGIADIFDKCPCDYGEPDECKFSIKDCKEKIRQKKK